MSEEEARRAIRRMEEQQEKLFSQAQEPEASGDPIERLGRRIARIIGYAITAGALWYLWTMIRG